MTCWNITHPKTITLRRCPAFELLRNSLRGPLPTSLETSFSAMMNTLLYKADESGHHADLVSPLHASSDWRIIVFCANLLRAVIGCNNWKLKCIIQPRVVPVTAASVPTILSIVLGSLSTDTEASFDRTGMTTSAPTTVPLATTPGARNRSTVTRTGIDPEPNPVAPVRTRIAERTDVEANRTRVHATAETNADLTTGRATNRTSAANTKLAKAKAADTLIGHSVWGITAGSISLNVAVSSLLVFRSRWEIGTGPVC